MLIDRHGSILYWKIGIGKLSKDNCGHIIAMISDFEKEHAFLGKGKRLFNRSRGKFILEMIFCVPLEHGTLSKENNI